MATTKEIKNRIKSVKDTQKITNAMYLISSTKMTRAKKELDNTRPYFEMLKKQIITMIQMRETAENMYFTDEVDRIPAEGNVDLTGPEMHVAGHKACRHSVPA